MYIPVHLTTKYTAVYHSKQSHCYYSKYIMRLKVFCFIDNFFLYFFFVSKEPHKNKAQITSSKTMNIFRQHVIFVSHPIHHNGRNSLLQYLYFITFITR